MNSSWFTHEQFMVMNFRKAGLTLICVGKHNTCVGNREIILIGNREIKRPRICHVFKTANFNSREFKWGYSILYLED